MRPRPLLLRGEVWQADLDPVVGHEQAGTRPVIVVSTGIFNESRSRLVVVVPVTRRDRNNPLHVSITPPDGGLRHRSFVLCDMMRSISTDRLRFFLGKTSPGVMDEISDRLRIILDL